MNVEAYCKALGLSPPSTGGQELLLGEIVASLWPCESVWLPFHTNAGALIKACERAGIATAFVGGGDRYADGPIFGVEACYFGTPTIVYGRALFPHAEQWDAAKERRVVRQLVGKCARSDYKRIVCGLGSGDVALDERLADLDCVDGVEPAYVVAEKRFRESHIHFTDWVIVKNLRRQNG